MSTSYPNLGKYQIIEEIGRGGMARSTRLTIPSRSHRGNQLLAPHLLWEPGFVELVLARSARGRPAAASQHHTRLRRGPRRVELLLCDGLLARAITQAG